MMGTKARLFTPVSAISLEALVPADHFYRHLDGVLDLGFVRDLVRDAYAERGRPSVDPVVFFRLQLVMFFEGIRSERQLLRLATDRLSVRWYLGYNLDEPLPDHSSLTRIRARYGLGVFRRFFEEIVEQCRQAGLVWGRELYFDATQVNANADLDSLTPRFAVAARAAIRTHLAALFPGGDTPHRAPQGAMASAPAPVPEAAADGEAAAERSRPEEPTPLPVPLSAPLREDLAAENAARHEWIAEEGRQHREATHGTYRRTADFRVSTTDPDATPMHLKGGGIHCRTSTTAPRSSGCCSGEAGGAGPSPAGPSWRSADPPRDGSCFVFLVAVRRAERRDLQEHAPTPPPPRLPPGRLAATRGPFFNTLSPYRLFRHASSAGTVLLAT